MTTADNNQSKRAEDFLKAKGLKDTLYDVAKDDGTWIKGGLSKLLDEYAALSHQSAENHPAGEVSQTETNAGLPLEFTDAKIPAEAAEAEQKEGEENHLVQVVPNSQSFNSLEMMLEYLKQTGHDDYMKKGIENTINMGYELTISAEPSKQSGAQMVEMSDEEMLNIFKAGHKQGWVRGAQGYNGFMEKDASDWLRKMIQPADKNREEGL